MLVLLSLLLSVFSTVKSTPDRSLLLGRRVPGPPELQLLLDCVPGGNAHGVGGERWKVNHVLSQVLTSIYSSLN